MIHTPPHLLCNLGPSPLTQLLTQLLTHISLQQNIAVTSLGTGHGVAIQGRVLGEHLSQAVDCCHKSWSCAGLHSAMQMDMLEELPICIISSLNCPISLDVVGSPVSHILVWCMIAKET